MAMELIKENIECEQLLKENTANCVVNAEYVVPDTHPDLYKVLILDAKPCITNKEMMQDKVYVEGKIGYNLLYLTKEDEKNKVYNITYTGSFSNYIEIPGAEHKMICEAECYVEHIEPMIINERKIGIEGILNLKCEVYKNYDFEIVKDVEGLEDIQMLKNPVSVDKIVGTVSDDLVAKASIQVPMDKPQVGNILKCDINIHNKEVNIIDDKIKVEANAFIDVLYKGKDSEDVICMVDDVLISKEFDLEGVNPSMDNYTDFKVDTKEYSIKEDDLGEDRIIDIEALVQCNTKVMYKEEIDIIEDAYSPSVFMNMSKKDYALNVMHGHTNTQTIVKGNIELKSDIPKVSEILTCNGEVYITNKKIVEDKVIIEAILNTKVMYKTDDEAKNIYVVNEEIPFSYAVDIPGCKIDMQSIAKVFLESIDASIEANTIAIKAVVEIYARVNYIIHKDFLVNIEPLEEDIPDKKSSITIYVIQNGDTLWKIAKKYYTTPDELIKSNDLENPDSIKPGEKLIIPGRAII